MSKDHLMSNRLMSTVKRVGIVACVLALAGRASLCLAEEDANAKVREQLPTAIGEAIRLLEAKDYEGFLKEFMRPDDLKKMTERVGLAKFATQIKGEKADILLRVFKSIKDLQPTFESDGKVASFPVTVAGAPRNVIKFTKIGKYWYLEN
jgi:hypothetical protein